MRGYEFMLMININTLRRISNFNFLFYVFKGYGVITFFQCYVIVLIDSLDYSKGVRYNKNKPTLQTIKNALVTIENYLVWSVKNHNETMKLVLPLIGSGVGGLDRVEVIKLYKQFFQHDIPFHCIVVIYGHNQSDYELIQFYLSN